jgi:N-acetylglucosaminyldiphosphoundecaprenol N-acetyl-beta-D-mannosaminyltransferase
MNLSNKKIHEVNILGYNVSAIFPYFPFEELTVISAINPHSYCIAKKNKLFQHALMESNILIPDGIGIVIAGMILNGVRISRVTGSDMHIHLLKEAEKHSLKVFYLGSSRNTLRKIEIKIHKEYPSVIVNTYAPPYKTEFSDEDDENMINAVNQFLPDILFVGMTAPKQESWVYQHKIHLKTKMICSIGAVFDFYPATKKRSGEFWQKIGLEWFPRLIREPKRLWDRTLLSAPMFLLNVFRVKFRNLTQI